MRSGGWKPFWASFGAALLVLLPLVGGTVLLERQQTRERVQAAQSQSGVAVRLPREADRLTALVCVAAEQPGFVLAYLNASQNCIHLLALPGELAVPFGEGERTLKECYAAAGPARCREALAQALPLPEDTRYLALSPETLAQAAEGLGSLRVSFAGALDADALAQAGLDSRVQELSAAQAQALLGGLDEAGLLPPEPRAAARAAVWDAFFRQKRELLPTALPAALRRYSGALLTDLTAPELYTLEETLEFLANNEAPVQSAALPGDWDAAAGRYSVSEASRAAVQTLLNVSPAAAQAALGSEP